jgi:hypothetical protein
MRNCRKMAFLATAMLENFPELISGYIVDAKVESCCLIGFAYKTYGYAPGAPLISGEITGITQYSSGHWLVSTREQDCFVIANFARGGRKSLMHLAELFNTAQLVRSRWRLQ